MRRDGGEQQLSDELIGSVVEAVRPHRSDGHGQAWRLLVAHHDQIKAWLKEGLTVATFDAPNTLQCDSAASTAFRRSVIPAHVFFDARAGTPSKMENDTSGCTSHTGHGDDGSQCPHFQNLSS